MKNFVRIVLICYLIFAAEQVFAVTDTVGVDKKYNADAIYLQLDEDGARNSVVHEQEEDGQGNILQENISEMNRPDLAGNKPIVHGLMQSNVEAEYNFFDKFNIDNNLEKERDDKVDEDTLLGKIIRKNITRTDVASYLLGDELTFNPEKGPISKIQFYGAYQGGVSSFWQAQDNDFDYNYGFGQVGATGRFGHTKNDFKIVLNTRPRKDLTVMQNLVADAYFVNSSIPHHLLILGYSRNQVGREGGSGSYNLPFVTRSQIARNFGSTRALGVRLIGNYSLMDYNFALNSSDRFFRQWFPGAEFTGWVDFKPLGRTDGRYGRLLLGGGLNAGHNGTNYTVGSLYAAYKYKRLWTNFEFGIADGYNGSYVSTDKAVGFNATLGYKITPQIQLIGRYDFFDPNRDIADNNRREYTAGINYFIKGQALRLILNYVFCQNDRTPDSHRLILATQILL